ncbi:MAG: EFR1 family ferrodoxin [Methanobacterium sp.]|jgi:ferredoxin
MNILLIYFSSSNNTAYVAKLIALGLEKKGLNPDLVRIEDFKAGKYDLADADVIGIGAPIYGGFAEPIKDWVKDFDFNGKKVFLFSTAGMAHFGSTNEMIKIVEKNNGKVIGGFEMTFQGCMDGIIYLKEQAQKYPIKKKELERAIEFGCKIADIVESGEGYVDSTYKHYLGAINLAIIRVIKLFVSKLIKVFVYVIDSKKCMACMKCEEVCPSGAIQVNKKKPIINHGLCVSCFRCFKECPSKALNLRFIGNRPYYWGPWQLEGYIDPEKIKYMEVSPDPD